MRWRALGLAAARRGRPASSSTFPSCAGHLFGVSICSEAIDARPIREQVREGRATFLVNVANDGWLTDGSRCASTPPRPRCARSRTGASWCGVTATGVSQIVGPDGVVRAEIASGVAGAIADHVGPHDAITLYTRRRRASRGCASRR